MSLLPGFGKFVLFALAYFVGSRLGYLLSLPGARAAIWPPAGIALAFFLATPRFEWPKLAAAALVAIASDGIFNGAGIGQIVAYWSANILAATVAALLILEIAEKPFDFNRPRSIIALLVVPTAIAAPLSALIGATTAAQIHGKPLVPTMLNGWAADVIGVAVMAPLVLVIFHDRGKFFTSVSTLKLVEGTAALCALALIAQMVFSKLEHPVSYLAVPIMLWLAFRFEFGGVALSLCVLAVPTIWHTIHGRGPFAGNASELTRVLLLQGYMGLNSISFLLLATVVHERRRSAAEVRTSEDRYRDLFENVSDMIHSIAPDGSMLYANRAWREALGYDNEDIAALSVFDVIHPEEIVRCRSLLQRMTSGEDIGRIETRFVTKRGTTITVEGQTNCRMENGIAICTRAIFRDVSDNRQQMRQLEQARRELHDVNAQLQRIATTDSLTGIHNRSSFQKRLEEEISRARRYATPLSLLMIDVDHFKQYNDSFGHAAGDHALATVANLLRDIARGTDVVARYGGEEFSIILVHTDVVGAIAVAERVRKVIEEHAWTKRAVTACVGASTLDETDPDGMKMIRQADAAMYRGKRTGRNRALHAQHLLDDKNEDSTKLFAFFDDPIAADV